jgi:hypothetical protein
MIARLPATGLGLKDWALVAVLSSVALAFYAWADDLIDIDDAYISYRYAENFAHGYGPVYNIGERVYGSTTMAWVSWLAVWSRLTGASAADISAVSTRAFLVLDCGLFYWLIRRLTAARWLSAIAVLLLLVAPSFVLIATFGMETMFYVFFILLSFLFFSRQQWFVAGLCTGAVFCTRPDGLAVIAAFAGVVMLDHFVSTKRQPLRRRLIAGPETGLWRMMLGFGVVAVPFALLCYTYYGSILPQTLYAKRTHVMVSGRWWMLRHFFGEGGWPVLGGAFISAARWFSSRAGRSLFGIHRINNGADRVENATAPNGVQFGAISAVLLWLAVYVAAWTVVRIDKYAWYIAATAIGSALAVILPLILFPFHRQRRLVQIVLTIWLLYVGWFWGTKSYAEIEHARNYLRQMEVPRFRIAKAINAFTEPGKERIGTGAIGIIGYYASTQKVSDYAHLVSPQKLLDDPANQPTLMVDYLLDFKNLKPHDPISGQNGGRSLNYELVCVRASSAYPMFLGIWARQDGTSTWDSTRVATDRPIGASFGSAVRLLGVTPIHCHVSREETIRCELVWRFQAPLSRGATIVYSLIGEAGRPFVLAETTGFFGNYRPYYRVKPGEAVLDFIDLPLPPSIAKGPYTLAVRVKGAKNCRLDEKHALPGRPDEARVTEVEVR